MTQLTGIIKETLNCHQYNKGDRVIFSYYLYIYSEFLAFSAMNTSHCITSR